MDVGIVLSVGLKLGLSVGAELMEGLREGKALGLVEIDGMSVGV